jgi:hypothetical protein
MKRSIPFVLAASVVLSLTSACSNAGKTVRSTSVVATAGAEELTVTELAELMGQSGTPIRAEEARTIAELWIDYQLLGKAAADGDSINDATLADSALWGPVANGRAKQWYERVSKTWTVDSLDVEALYKAGTILAARQVFLAVPQYSRPADAAVLRQRVDSLRAKITVANFAEMARKHSADAQTAASGGVIPGWVAARGIMEPAFELGITLTKFGTVSAPISSPVGVHIVYRPTYAEAAALIAPAARGLALQRAESTYFARLDSANTVKLIDNVPVRVREVVADMSLYQDSSLVLATMTGGNFTAGQFVRWVDAYPAEQAMQSQFANAPDSVVGVLLKALIRNELFLRQADSAGVTVSPTERQQYRRQLRQFAQSAFGTLGVDARMLPDSLQKADSARRAAFTARRIDAFVSNMVNRRGLILQTPRQLRQWLRLRYPGSAISPGALGNVLQLADRIRISKDSARFANPKPPAGAPGTPNAPGGPPQKPKA